MEYALKGVPVTEYLAPEGVVNVNGEWYYNEYARGSGVSSVGTQDPAAVNAGQLPALGNAGRPYSGLATL